MPYSAPVEVQREGPLPVLVGLFEEMPAQAGARVVEQEVDTPAAALRRLLDHPLHVVFLRDVAVEPQNLAGKGLI